MTPDLARLLKDPGFTPGKAHLDELFSLLGGQDEKEAEAAEKALLRFGPDLGDHLLARLPSAEPPLRGRLGRVLGKIAVAKGGERWHQALLGLLDDPDPKTRRNAIIALGKGGVEGAEEALLSLWGSNPPVEQMRSIAASLGKIGGGKSLSLLRAVDHDDPELMRIVAQSTLMLARTLDRAGVTDSGIDAQAAAGKPLPVVLRCRRGLEDVLLSELEGVVSSPKISGPGAIKGQLEGPLRRLFQARVMLSFSFPLPWLQVRNQDVPGAMAEALTSPEARAIFAAFSTGPVRYRLDWQEGGHKRGLTWMCARRVEQADPALRNDPTGSSWEVLASEKEGSLRVELSPKGLDDPRFAYRRKDVPAASHPTIAAALARLAGVRDDDVVWDPFVGSGLELCERARLGPFKEMYGTDIDPGALAAAEANLKGAGVQNVSLMRADARLQRVAGLSLVITNPPMGRRVARHEEVEGLLADLVEHVSHQLVPGGRLVWLSPFPQGTAEMGHRAGLDVRRGEAVDMGGFWTELQVMTKPARPAPFRAPFSSREADRPRGGPREAERPRDDRRPDRFRDDRRPELPRDDRRPEQPRDDRRPWPPRDDRRPEQARDDRRPEPPRGPSREAERPRDDRRPWPPRDDRRPEQPRDDRRPWPPRDDRRPELPRDDRRPEQARDDRRPGPPRDDRRPEQARDDRRPEQARDDRRPGPPRDDRRPRDDRGPERGAPGPGPGPGRRDDRRRGPPRR